MEEKKTEKAEKTEKGEKEKEARPHFVLEVQDLNLGITASFKNKKEEIKSSPRSD